MKKLPVKSLKSVVLNGDHEEQNSIIGQVVSIFDTIPATYGTVKGFTDSEVLVQITAKEVRKINPFEVEISLQFYQHDHGIIYDFGVQVPNQREELAAPSEAQEKPSERLLPESVTTSQVKEEIPAEAKIEPPVAEKKPKPSSSKFSLNLNEPEKEEPPKKEKPKKKHFSFVKQKVGA